MRRLEHLLTFASIMAAAAAGAAGLVALWLAEVSFLPTTAAMLCRIGLGICGVALLLILSSTGLSHRRLAREQG